MINDLPIKAATAGASRRMTLARGGRGRHRSVNSNVRYDIAPDDRKCHKARYEYAYTHNDDGSKCK